MTLFARRAGEGGQTRGRAGDDGALARPSGAEDGAAALVVVALDRAPPRPPSPGLRRACRKRALSAVPHRRTSRCSAPRRFATPLDLSRGPPPRLSPPSPRWWRSPPLAAVLDVSRNQLRELRVGSRACAHSARAAARATPRAPSPRRAPRRPLDRLPHLTILDLRYNQKLRPAAPGVPAFGSPRSPRAPPRVASCAARSAPARRSSPPATEIPLRSSARWSAAAERRPRGFARA